MTTVTSKRCRLHEIELYLPVASGYIILWHWFFDLLGISMVSPEIFLNFLMRCEVSNIAALYNESSCNFTIAGVHFFEAVVETFRD